MARYGARSTHNMYVSKVSVPPATCKFTCALFTIPLSKFSIACSFNSQEATEAPRLYLAAFLRFTHPFYVLHPEQVPLVDSCRSASPLHPVPASMSSHGYVTAPLYAITLPHPHCVTETTFVHLQYLASCFLSDCWAGFTCLFSGCVSTEAGILTGSRLVNVLTIKGVE